MQSGIDAQITHCRKRRMTSDATANQGPNSSHEHRERERLTEIIIRARIQGFRLVQMAVFGDEHEDRGPIAGRS
jgi:hypothetical protein